MQQLQFMTLDAFAHMANRSRPTIYKYVRLGLVVPSAYDSLGRPLFTARDIHQLGRAFTDATRMGIQ